MHKIILAFALLLICCQQILAESLPGFRIQPGFEITEFAGSNLANDIHCMTIDSKGRIIVSGPGYIRILIDEKNEGRASKAIDFAAPKEGAQGLLWEGDSLLAVVDGGLWRYREMPDGKAAKPELLRKLKTGGEHDCHAIRRGPDGWLYLIGGNNSKFDKSYASLSTSPIKEPIAGCLVRFSPDYKDSEILADGFRNPYSFDISPDGDIFTFDSDNERCVSLPWYEPTRLYHVIPGRNHGWMSPQYGSFWRRPPYFFDVSPPLLTLGRGSPTGVVYYDRNEFPAANRGLYLLDWTFGRIYSVNLERRWTSFEAKSQVFLESTGSNGFAPTAAAIHPMTGDIYVSIGGRGTRGAVYRIHFAAKPDAMETRKPNDWPKWGPEWKEGLGQQLLDYSRPPYHSAVNLRALIDLKRHHARFAPKDLLAAIREHWSFSDRNIEQTIVALISVLPRESQRELIKEATTIPEKLLAGYGICDTEPQGARELAMQALKQKPAAKKKELLDAVRLLQKSIGDIGDPQYVGQVWEGYSPRKSLPKDRYPEIRSALRANFPTRSSATDLEISRLLAILEDDGPAILDEFLDPTRFGSNPDELIHYWIVLSRFGGPPTQVEKFSGSYMVLRFHRWSDDAKRDTNWPLRMVELVSELSKRDPGLLKQIGRRMDLLDPEVIIYARCKGFDRVALADRLVTAWEEGKQVAWTPEHIGLLSLHALDRVRPILRQLWQRGGFDEAILPILARIPQEADREKYVSGLGSPKLALVRTCLFAIATLPIKDDQATLLALVRCLRALPEGKEADTLRKQIADVLKEITHQDFGPDKAKWTAWFERTYPDLAKKLGGRDGVDVAAWQKRLAAVNWSKGEAQRGKAVFQKAGCINCHSGSQAMGPDLAGVGSRFSRDDLFTAIIQPSKDISPRYRTSQIETTDGKTYQGLIVYEAVDGVILQTGPADTVRIDGKKIESRRLTDTSLMPVGLIDKLTDMEIADLYAFLRVK
jgi:putative heme-binding domain-containing protein